MDRSVVAPYSKGVSPMEGDMDGKFNVEEGASRDTTHLSRTFLRSHPYRLRLLLWVGGTGRVKEFCVGKTTTRLLVFINGIPNQPPQLIIIWCGCLSFKKTMKMNLLLLLPVVLVSLSAARTTQKQTAVHCLT